MNCLGTRGIVCLLVSCFLAFIGDLGWRFSPCDVVVKIVEFLLAPFCSLLLRFWLFELQAWLCCCWILGTFCLCICLMCSLCLGLGGSELQLLCSAVFSEKNQTWIVFFCWNSQVKARFFYRRDLSFDAFLCKCCIYSFCYCYGSL